TTDAFNVNLADVIPAGETFVAGSLANTAGQAPDKLSFDAGTRAIHASWGTFALGSSSTLQFQAQLDPNDTPRPIVTHTASETWTSLPGTDPGQITPNNPDAFERTGKPAHGGQLNDYLASGSAPVNVVDASISISPLTPVNEVNHAETFLITVTAFPAGSGTPSFATPTVNFLSGAPGTIGPVTPLAGPTNNGKGSSSGIWTVKSNTATAA